MNLFWSLALAGCLIVPCAVRAGSSGEDPYAMFARSPQGARLLVIARESMGAHWSDSPSRADTVDIPWPAAPRGIYISLTDGQGTRACVGNATPYRGSLVETVRALAVQSLQADRRHPPVRREELPGLRIVISFAGPAEALTDPMQVDPGRDGLLVSSSGGSVAFLPGEARTVAWALHEARRIGVIRGPMEDARYYRFPVIVLAEVPPPSHPVERSNASP
ncbi:MAG TPA: AMMECR1 domain-containing protein [Tepidiformaceae bacterium]|nr:AMMECR1 domain-containing protein [Tepidiformaceae bacterium]